MDQTNIYKSSPDNKDSPKSQYLTTVVPANKKALTLEGGHSMKNCGMWNLKYKTSSPKFYELLIKKSIQRRHLSVSQELLQTYQDVSQCGD